MMSALAQNSQGQAVSQDQTVPLSRVIRVHGMRRSGNHAIIDWILRNAPMGNGLFFNNCHPRQDPIEGASDRILYQSGRETPIPQSHAFDVGETNFAVVSFEDTRPPQNKAPIWPDTNETRVIIYRSFLNWSASLLRKIHSNANYGTLERIRVMVTAALKYKDMLDRLSKNAAFVGLCYDDWVADPKYRQAALVRLGLPGTDLDLGAVARYGGGSSFQGQNVPAHELQTDQRAVQMAGDPEYQMFLWNAARDIAFISAVAVHFPQDAAHLSRISNQTSMREIQI